MEDEKRGPGRPAKPKLTTVKLLKGYVPSHFPEDRKPTNDVLPKAAAGSIIEVPEDEAREMVKRRIAELTFDGEALDWMSSKEKRERDAAAERKALNERLATIYAQKMANLK
jgi:hypothetical protein